MKKALITGITGQDGSYLAEILLNKGYVVHGIMRRSSSFNTSRIDHIYNNSELLNNTFFLHYGDLVDASNLNRLLELIQPDEIYNLAAQSHVKVSFQLADYTAQVGGLGALKLLDSLRETGLSQTKFYQASSSELFGKVRETPQNEGTPFCPRSPYAVAKLYAYWMIINYREAYNVFASNGILFNHESPRRGETFITRKITRAICRILLGMQDKLIVGNLNAQRDWGYAPEYCEGMWKILQHPVAEDFVLATGETHSVREFIEMSFHEFGISIKWQGTAETEVGVIDSVDLSLSQNAEDVIGLINNMIQGTTVVEVSPEYYRPTEVELLLGDATKAKKILNWNPKVKFSELVHIMIQNDFELALHEFYASQYSKKTRSILVNQ